MSIKFLKLKFHSKVGFILSSIFIIIFLINYIRLLGCGGFLCGAGLMSFNFPWYDIDLLSRLGFFEFYAGVLINTVILYYIGYGLENLFSKNKLPKTKFSLIVLSTPAIILIATSLKYNKNCQEIMLQCGSNYIFPVIGFLIGAISIFYILKRRRIIFSFVSIIALTILIGSVFFSDDQVISNINQCNKIERYNFRNDCFEKLAEYKKDHTLCSNIIDESGEKNIFYERSCLLDLVKITKDEKICFDFSDLKQKERCYENAGFKEQFDRICDDNEALNEEYKIPSRDRCYFNRAVRKNDVRVCSLIIANDPRDKCYGIFKK